jgi:glyoxylase I family protein
MSTSVLEIRGLDHVVLRVTDLNASLRFYADALGCKLERQLEELGLYQLRAGSSLIDLVRVDSPLGKLGGGPPVQEGRNVDHFAIQLGRFDESAIRAHLAQHEIEPGDVAQRYGAEGNGPSMYIRDPDGNVVELKGPPSAT